MGACNGANYISRQQERNRIVNTRFVRDKRYSSYLRGITKGELFGADFIWNVIPNELVPFDYETFERSDSRFVAVATACDTGKPVYFETKGKKEYYMKRLQASASMPFVQKPVVVDGKKYLDGGIADSLPIERSISDGNEKNVLILTQPKGFRKKESNLLGKLGKIFYSDLPLFTEALANRNRRYNESMDTIEELEAKGDIFVIRPKTKLNVKRAEKDVDKLYYAYDEGYYEAQRLFDDMLNYMK